MLLVHKCTHEINPTGKFPKGKRVRFTSEASIWKCFVRLRQKRSNIYTARTNNFIFWIQLEKQPLSQTYGDKHCQSLLCHLVSLWEPRETYNVQTKAWFRLRTFHEPKLIRIKTDPNYLDRLK